MDTKNGTSLELINLPLSSDEVVIDFAQMEKLWSMQISTGQHVSGCYLQPDTKYWVDENNQLHGEHWPAVIFADGSVYWYKHGIIHRDNGPAVSLAEGTHVWYNEGQLHREDGPAAIFSHGEEQWWIDGNEIIMKSPDDE